MPAHSESAGLSWLARGRTVRRVTVIRALHNHDWYQAVKVGTQTARRGTAIRVVILSLLIFAGAFGTHEVMHLVVIYALGGHGSLVVRPWDLALVDFTIYAVHAQPDQPLGLLQQALVNFLGPALAAIPLVALVLSVREPVARVALTANVVILAFYAFIETADLLMETRLDVDLSVLTTPEFNYGVPALIIVVAAVIANQRLRAGE